MMRSLLVVSLMLLFVKNCHGNVPHIQMDSNEDEVEIIFNSKGDQDDYYQSDMRARITIDGVVVDLNLRKNPEISEDVPVFLQRNGKIQQFRTSTEEAVSVYQDKQHEASFLIWNMEDKSNNNHTMYNMFGTFLLRNQTYLVQPPDTFSHTRHTIAKSNGEEMPMKNDYVLPPGHEERVSRRQDSRFQFDKKSRAKRQTTTAYEVEILIAVDYPIYNYWYDKTTGTASERNTTTINTIKQFYSFVMNSLNLRYQSVASSGAGFSITCLYAGIYIATTSSDSSFVEDNILNAATSTARAQINGSFVLEKFKDWAIANLNNVEYDHAMLFTGYDIVSVSNGQIFPSTAGVAYLSAACGNFKYSINEDHFLAGLVTTAAHELGHNLGAGHDGEGNNCLASAGFIMTASSITNENNTNMWIFSSCSISAFGIFTSGLGDSSSNCLTSRSSNYNASALDAFANDIAGQVYDADYQCAESEGVGSYLYRADYDEDYTSVCQRLACYKLSSNTTSVSFGFVLPWEGTTCGNGKFCEASRCVSSANAPTGISDSCPFGDVPYNVPFQSQNCSEYLGDSSTSARCYGLTAQKSCCATCAVYKEQFAHVPDCEYGDKATGCQVQSCDFYPASTLALCCGTCAPATTTSTTTTTTTTPTTSTTTPTTTITTPTTTTTTPTTTTTTPTTTTTTPTTTTTTPTTTTTTPTTTTTTPTTTTTTPTTTTTTQTTNTTTQTTTSTTPTTSTTTPTTTTTTPTTITTTPTTTTTTPTTTTTTPTTTTTTPTTPTTTTTTPTTTTTTLTTTTTTPTTTTTTPTTTTTTPTTSTTTPTTTSTTPTTTSTTQTTTTTTPTTTTTTPTTPTTTTTTPTTTTTTPTTTTTTPTTTTTTPTTTTTTPTTTTTTPTTTTTTPTTTTTTPTTTTTTPTTTTTTPTTTTTTPTTTTTTPTTTTTTPTTTTTTPTTTTTTPTTTTTTPTTTTTTPTTTTTTPTTTTTTPTTTTTTPTTTTTTPTTTTTTPTTTTTTPTTTTTTPTTTTTTPTTTTTTPTTTTTTPTTTTTTPTTTTTTPTTTTTTPTTTSTTPTTTTTTPTTTTTTPTTTTTTPTTTSTTPTTTTTTPTTTTTTPTTTTTTPTTTSTTPTTTTTTPTTTTTTPTTTTTTTPTTTTPSTTTTTPTITSISPTTTSTTPTTTTTTPTTTTTTPTTTTTTPTTTTTTPTTTTTTTPTTTTPSTTTTTPTITSISPTTTSTTPTTTTTTPTTTTTTPTTTTTTPTTTTTTPTTTTTIPTTTTTTPTTTTTTPTTTTTTPTTSTTTPTTTTTTPTTSITTPTTAATATARRRSVVIVISLPISANGNLGNPNSASYLLLVIEISNELRRIYLVFLGPRYKAIRIKKLSPGSVIVEYEVEVEDDPVATSDLNKANVGIVTGDQTITVDNQTISATYMDIANVTVTNDTLAENVCQLFTAAGGCASDESCIVVDGQAACQPEKTTSGIALVLAIAIGLPVFLILVLVFIGLTIRAARLKKLDNKRLKQSESSSRSDRVNLNAPKQSFPPMTPYGGISRWNENDYNSDIPYHLRVSHSSRQSRRDLRHSDTKPKHHHTDRLSGNNHQKDKRFGDKHHKRDRQDTLQTHVYDNKAADFDSMVANSYIQPYDYA